MTDADLEWIEERAGILQFDAGLSPRAALLEARRLWMAWRAR